MKKQFSIGILFILFSFIKVNAQNGIYIISEKYDGIVSSPPTFDSVFVTNPVGTTTKYSIPSYITNPGEHNSQFNIILNGITSLGYKIITPVQREGVSNTTLAQSHCIIRTIYLAKSWLTSIKEISKVEDSQISIKIYPNPTIGLLQLEISCSKEFDPNEVVIINQLGFIVFSLPINYLENSIITLDVSSLNAATYLLSVRNKKYYSKTYKFIKQ